jgi:hypothetical protein
MSQYAQLDRLGIPIGQSPLPHVAIKDIKAKLSKDQFKAFHRFFGIQTCPSIPKLPAVFPGDAEAVLVRMFGGKLVGSQKIPD